ncbi:Gta1p KNAG_0G00450 [Huiozyma naganishii CBS 8797]|uniref:Fibronectin type-III domain-containing protein n=1 Tax=Huiozyma naganishii (strain ATCC MYA-139 / BCRC 22969 / CBS 8797 / KCTC 17520 / NBRC 10181 / NCYC 3082 / Yp74L-3) TaxID=1071383 RepID=J7S0Q5_HUIN7|nr:hypothetical protein KNAG_0G00450 [Kazachstania naganishii CBS 8797]CCK71102.1 hypothetical protein KNAG_0G00450 [Kazachstania naganishii CBS 8797]
MVGYGICVLTSLVWLCVRLYKFLTISIARVMSTLDVSTPPAVKLSIDKISRDSITVHWENEPAENAGGGGARTHGISQYLLYLNNSKLGVFPNCPQALYTCCSINGLKCGETYQIDFVTVNRSGYINKLPSVFLTTRANDRTIPDPKTSGPLLRRRWRRNTLTQSTSNEEVTPTSVENNINPPPSYTTLTNLADLEQYSIEDLKKILVCAQEDLHDVLGQQSTLLQEFQENREQLSLELENLKTHWSHELDFKKSLKSSIKSLENAKLFSDVKYTKLNQRIEKIKQKLDKMNQDIFNWETVEKSQLNEAKLKKDYKNRISLISGQIQKFTNLAASVQQEIDALERHNKELAAAKRSGIVANPSTPNDTKKPASDERINKVIRKLNSLTNKDTGLLSQQGEEYLTKLKETSPIIKIIKEQYNIDKKCERKWGAKRSKIVDQCTALEQKFDRLSMENHQLRSNGYQQTAATEAQQKGDTSWELLADLPNGFVNGTIQSSTTMNGQIANQLESASPPGINENVNRENSHIYSGFTETVEQHSPHFMSPITSIGENYIQPPKNDGYGKADRLPIFPSGGATASTGVTNVNANSIPIANPLHFPWDRSGGSLDPNQNIDYGNTDHLITGLQDMIYDEADYPDKISTYSKGFTTDQLDNYWTTQKSAPVTSLPLPPQATPSQPMNIGNGASQLHPPYMEFASNEFDTTLISHYGNGDSYSKSPLLMQNQSLLAATLNDSANLSPFASSLRQVESYGTHISTAGSGNVNAAFPSQMDGQSIGTGLISVESTPNGLPSHVLSSTTPPPERSAKSSRDGLFHSPSFNFIWHSPQKNTAKKTGFFHSSSTDRDTVQPHKTHKREKSSSSSISTWSAKLSLKSKTSAHNSNPPQSPTRSNKSKNDDIGEETEFDEPAIIPPPTPCIARPGERGEESVPSVVQEHDEQPVQAAQPGHNHYIILDPATALLALNLLCPTVYHRSARCPSTREPCNYLQTHRITRML